MERSSFTSSSMTSMDIKSDESAEKEEISSDSNLVKIKIP